MKKAHAISAIETMPRRRAGTFAEGMLRTRNASQRNGNFATGMKCMVWIPEEAHKGTFASGMRRLDNGVGFYEGTFAEGLAGRAA